MPHGAPRHRQAARGDRGALRRPLAGAPLHRAAPRLPPNVDCFRTDDPQSSPSSSSWPASIPPRSRSSSSERTLVDRGRAPPAQVAGQVYQQMEIEYGPSSGGRARPRTSTPPPRARATSAGSSPSRSRRRTATRGRVAITVGRSAGDGRLLRARAPTSDVELPALPVLPLKETVVFPESMTPLAIGQERSIRLIDDVVAGERLLALVPSQDA